MTNSMPRVLLVDDDETFALIVAKAAERELIPITVCHSIKEVGKLPKWDFEIAIVDYDLGDFNGIQLTDILGRLRRIPVILVSQYRDIVMKRWPSCIKEFVNKSSGPQEILEMAKKLHRLTLEKSPDLKA